MQERPKGNTNPYVSFMATASSYTLINMLVVIKQEYASGILRNEGV